MRAFLGRHALIIGTELYRDKSFTNLPSCRADVDVMTTVLKDRAIGGFTVATGRNLPADQMRDAISGFCQERTDDDLALIYITGHGVRGTNGEFTFVAHDTDREDIASTGVSASFVNDCIENCFAAQRVAILDPCESGAFTLGFRTSPTKSGAATRRRGLPPVAPRGAYVLASSDATEASYATNTDTAQNPAPSVFTAAVADVLHSGSAGRSASAIVSVDDLFEAVGDRLRDASPPQTPVKSAIRVTGAIPIATRPLGPPPEPHVNGPAEGQEATTAEVHEPEWPDLIGYLADVVRAESEPPLLRLDGTDHVIVLGAERALRGDVDTDGCIAAPAGAARLLSDAADDELWMGWPSVLLYRDDRGPSRTETRFAPLLVRRVEIAGTADDPRLRPVGPVVPHGGLARARLETDAADVLAST
ncbi:caspase family protein [Pseudonocardia sulfidoxydans]|uniref:caspase, EACC1-associated type n=1 Tax=Pseudonocardia sulfidoxydans TaxID=54011 RepID=UPI00164980D2